MIIGNITVKISILTHLYKWGVLVMQVGQLTNFRGSPTIEVPGLINLAWFVTFKGVGGY